MKHIQIILGLILFASVSTFAQSPRIKLNQITKDTVKGSVLISSPSDSGMVYSRDFYISYGADTLLILYGDTIGGVGGGFASVLSDGVTVLGDGTTGNELKVDTSLVSTIQGLVDTLTNRGYLTANETITLSGDVTGSGTTAITATVVDDSHNHIISNVDFLQDSLTAKANASELSNYVTIAGTETITGAKTFTNTFTQSGGDANFDSGTLFVDESANRVGIGTSSPSAPLEVYKSSGTVDTVAKFGGNVGYATFNNYGDLVGIYQNTILSLSAAYTSNTAGFGTQSNSDMVIYTNNVRRITIESDGDVVIADLAGTGTRTVEATSNGTLQAPSTMMIKENIESSLYGINTLKNLNPVTFYYKDKEMYGSVRDIGFLAEEVYNIIPEASGQNADGSYYLDKSKLTAVTVKAIQEQQAIIETQEQEINQLKTLITDLTNRLIILENK